MTAELDALLTAENEAIDALLAQVARDGEETRKTLEALAEAEREALDTLLAGLEPTVCPYCGRPMESKEAA